MRWAKDADTLLERLAAEHRRREQVAIVSSDAAVRGTSGVEVRKLSSQSFLAELARPTHADRTAATCATASTRRRSPRSSAFAAAASEHSRAEGPASPGEIVRRHAPWRPEIRRATAVQQRTYVRSRLGPSQKDL